MRLPTRANTSGQFDGLDRRPLTIAHRGAGADAPENTVAAIRRAVELGADGIELDVQQSRDGVLIVMHDTTLDRTTNVRQVFPERAPWRVSDFTLGELRLLDAGSWKSDRYAGEHVPTLSESIELVADSATGLLLELKRPALYPGVVRNLVSTLTEAAEVSGRDRAAPRVVVQSFDFAAMKHLKTRAPLVRVGLLGTPKFANLPALATWADQVNPQYRTIGRSYVDEVHRLGMECLVWTVDARWSLRRAARLGVDGVITNRPDRLIAALSREPRAQLRGGSWSRHPDPADPDGWASVGRGRREAPGGRY